MTETLASLLGDDLAAQVRALPRPDDLWPDYVIGRNSTALNCCIVGAFLRLHDPVHGTAMLGTDRIPTELRQAFPHVTEQQAAAVQRLARRYDTIMTEDPDHHRAIDWTLEPLV